MTDNDKPRVIAHIRQAKGKRDFRIMSTAYAHDRARLTVCGAPATDRDFAPGDAALTTQEDRFEWHVCARCYFMMRAGG